MPNKILVALDNSAMSRSVFNEALTLAKATESHLRILHIISLGKATIQGGSGHSADISPFLFDQKANSADENHFFKDYVTEATHAGIRTDFFQYCGEPGQIICNFALVWESDLIVMGRREHASLSELPLGSVSDYVVHHAPCSVHIVQHTLHSQSETIHSS